MELLNGLGEPITPVFNNQLIHLKAPSGPKPGWMRQRLTESQVARLSGSPEPEAPELVASPPAIPQKAKEKEQTTEQSRELPQAEIKLEGEDEVKTQPEADPKPTAPAGIDEQQPELPIAEEPLAEQTPTEQPLKPEAALPTPPTPAQEKPAEPQQPTEEEPKLKPSSSLGGSARELLNSDGRLRKP